MKEHKLLFPITLFLFQIILIGLFGGYVKYDSNYAYKTKNKTSGELIKEFNVPKIAQNYYTSFQDVHVMIFIGFGFLMVFLKKYGYGAVAYNLLLSGICIQWATLLNAWISQRILYKEHPDDWNIDPATGEKVSPGTIRIGYLEIMTADFTCAAVLITYGAVLGKASRFQLLMIVIFECIFFAINEVILVEFISIRDSGGSIVIHLFGAYFGLAVSFIIQNSGDDHKYEGSNYHSDLFSMIGTLFLWVFWPSFNSGALGDDPALQQIAIVNTYFALAACTVGAFATSALVDKEFKLNIVHIQNATLAGGVAVGACADLSVQHWGAALIGFLGGVLSVIGYAFVTPFLNSTMKLHDTCGVHNLHGMPAVFSGICSAIAAAALPAKTELYAKVDDHTRSFSQQGGYQVAGMAVSFALALLGGVITGLIIKPFNRPSIHLYADDPEWLVPEMYTIENVKNEAGKDEEKNRLMNLADSPI